MINNIPEGWKSLNLDKFCVKIGDGLHSTPIYTEKSDYYFINGNNLKNNKLVISKNTKMVPKSEYDRHKKELNEYSIFMSINGTIGQLALYSGEKIVLGKSASYFITNNNTDKSYLYQYLQLGSLQNYFKNEVTGSTIKNLSLKSIRETKILVPEKLEEQRRIVEILESWDDMISALEDKCEKLATYKKALMQKLLTPQPHWEEKKLGDITHVKTGNKDMCNKVEDGEYPFFVRSDKVERIDSYAYDGEAILVPGEGRIGEIFHYINGKFDYHQRVYKISDFVDCSGKFIYYYLNKYFMREAMKHNVKAAVNSLRLPVFTEMKMYLPPLLEQEEIANTLSQVDEYIDLTKQQLANYKDQKKALMQKLLTGEWRV
jgi:type I restriction enzyme S subunit